MNHIQLVFHGRFPAEKAGSLFAAMSAQAFADANLSVELLVPRRLDRVRKSVTEYWGIRENFAVRYLPVIDLFSFPIIQKIAFPVSLATFTVSFFVYLIFTGRKYHIVYSNEMVPIFAALLSGRPSVLEVHDFPGGLSPMWRYVLRHVDLVIATNEWKAKALKEQFNIPEGRILIERNAVDINRFSPVSSRAEARAALTLPAEARIALYTGHLYQWKGVDTLAEAAKRLPEITVYFVGGTPEMIARLKEMYGQISNIHIVGFVPHSEIPMWQTAADVVVLPNSGKEGISALYTSPMKLFEYMASGIPIVASDIPSVREIVDERSVYFAKADDAPDFARAIREALTDVHSVERAEHARKVVENHTWDKRASRIKARIERCTRVRVIEKRDTL